MTSDFRSWLEMFIWHPFMLLSYVIRNLSWCQDTSRIFYGGPRLHTKSHQRQPYMPTVLQTLTWEYKYEIWCCTSPAGNISLPCLTCNMLYSDYFTNPFKLYTSSDPKSCPSYKFNSSRSKSVEKKFQDACDSQYNSFTGTDTKSSKANRYGGYGGGGKDTYSSASVKCKS